MLTTVLPFLVYLISFPLMLVAIFKVELGVLFFITIVPIIVLMKKIAVFPGGHNIPDYLLIAITVGWFLKAYKEKKKYFKSTPINTVVILLIAGSIINLIWGYIYSELPATTHMVRLITWKNYMILPIIYFISINNLDEERVIKKTIFCILLTILASDFNFYSTFKWLKTYHYTDSLRIEGAFRSLGPNEMGIFYSMYTVLLIGISYFVENKKLKYFMLLVSACNLYPIIYSYSRTAYIGSIIGIFTIGLLKDRRLLFVLFLIILLYRVVLPNSVVERIGLTFFDTSSIEVEEMQRSAVDVGGITINTVGRAELWDKAKNHFYQSPILGTGFDTFRHQEGYITHSVYFKILAEQGIIGIIIFIIFNMTILIKSYKLFKLSKNKLGKGIGLGFFTCVIVHLVGSISGDQSMYYNIMAIYWVFLGIMASLERSLHAEGESS